MADLYDLLEKTSRTFALSIPLLAEPTRRQVAIAYLLFRIADTFEDAIGWPRRRQTEALRVFSGMLAEPRREDYDAWVGGWVETWQADVPIDHSGYLELLDEVPFVLAAYADLDPVARQQVRDHTVRTAEGMIAFVERFDADGRLELRDLDDLRHYCYIVAGIVGEMLTELYLLATPALRAEPVAGRLRGDARGFGEALQLVNILKDAAFDADEGRGYLPRALGRDEVFAVARADLAIAARYVLNLQEAGADRGIVAFNALNLLLAFATVDKVEADGPGSKISRERVFEIVDMMNYALDHGLPVVDRDAAAGSPSIA